MKKKYNPTFKAKIVLLSYQNNCVNKLEEQFGLSRGALSRWRREHESLGRGAVTGEYYCDLRQRQQNIHKLEQKIRDSEIKFEILKKAGPLLGGSRITPFLFIAQNDSAYTVKTLCEALSISKSEYYKWRKNYISPAKKRRMALQLKIATIFFESDQIYGSLRIAAELKNAGHQVSICTVKRHMKELGLRSRLTTRPAISQSEDARRREYVSDRFWHLGTEGSPQ